MKTRFWFSGAIVCGVRTKTVMAVTAAGAGASHIWLVSQTRRKAYEQDRDVAAHHLTKAAADDETKPSAPISAGRRGRCLGKLLEQLAHLLRRHPDAGVAHC